MYGESYGTSTLARALRQRAADVYEMLDDGTPWAEVAEEAEGLMEGAIVLWKRLLKEAYE